MPVADAVSCEMGFKQAQVAKTSPNASSTPANAARVVASALYTTLALSVISQIAARVVAGRRVVAHGVVTAAGFVHVIVFL